MNNERYNSVWEAIEDTPEEAENMKLRATLIRALNRHIGNKGLTQVQAAQLLGVTQPRISDLKRGKIHLFSLDSLVNMASAAKLQLEIHIRDAA
jgi:predicted XRE-type DNA-binding protein